MYFSLPDIISPNIPNQYHVYRNYAPDAPFNFSPGIKFSFLTVISKFTWALNG